LAEHLNNAMRVLTIVSCSLAMCALGLPVPEAGVVQLDSLPHGQFRFTGPVGERVEANVENWLLRAPQSNPGMLEMFRMRDRQPAPQLVPWAGEFVGKYLISAVQALRMTGDPRLLVQVSNVVAAFIATQAEDGYLGPFPKDTRLLKNWDLWGHYHALYALVLWHQHTGDAAALAAARKAADLVCLTYLDTTRRVVDAGDPEMNMSILTGMAMMYCLTGEPRYLRMAREVEKDWERAGDYLRAGLDGREYFQSPRPRWESLHDLQGLFELWRITGEGKYRDAFIHHWRSIRRWDRRNTGAFSSGEQATGNPYAPTAIETCCTVAWIALTVDYLKLTGDPRAADDLELATLNGGLGAQHVSGRWWTYNTPMDGVREASAHTIVFQARAGTPELNCCSVNGPRVLGMLSEWAVMSTPQGLAVNSYLPGTFTVSTAGQEISLVLDLDYPIGDSQRVRIAKSGDAEWTLQLRIPAWSANTRVKANFEGAPVHASAGSYLEMRRRWKTGDEVALKFDLSLRAVAGANEAAGKVSLYRGPLLLAWDQAQTLFDEEKIPAVNLSRLAEARASASIRSQSALESPAWLQVDLPTDQGNTLRLVDFASAGSAGTHYRSWLAASEPPPPPAFTLHPRDGERIRPGAIQFQWRTTRSRTNLSYRVEIADDDGFTRLLLATNHPGVPHMTLEVAANTNAPGPERWWRVITVGPHGETAPDVPPARFTLDPKAPAQVLPPSNQPGPNGELILHSLRGEAAPKFGKLNSSRHESRDAEGTRVNGRNQMLVYSIPVWPEGDFTVAVRVQINEMPKERLGQIFSAWTAGMDDPLRLAVQNGELFARIEAGQVFGTAGTPLSTGTWHHVAAVKSGATLKLFLDGQLAGSCAAPELTTTATSDCALGGNPKFNGNEFLAAAFADFGLWERALSPTEVQRLVSQER
jgi:uncharacterized protein